MTNRNMEALGDFVNRMFNIEDEFNSAKAERDDLVKDLKAEIKSRKDETGVDAKEVQRLVKIKLDEAGQREAQQILAGDLDTYDCLFGASSEIVDDDEV